MTGIRYYARDGAEITMEQWVGLLDDFEYKRVAYTRIRKDIHVSTVWLGMEHAFLFHGPDPEGPVHIFETMVFGGDLDQEQWRYATEAQALDGHAQMVEQVRMAYQMSLPDAVRPAPAEQKEER